MVKTGIYLITNLINNKKYVGQSTHIYKRWGVHKNSNNWIDIPLYRAFKKYGLNNFKFEILEECSKEKLDDLEIYWISYFDCFNNGYNLTPGGSNGGHYIKLSKELVEAIINDLKYSKLTGKELSIKYGINKDMISHINNGKCWKQSNLIYPIRKQIKKVFTCPICGAEVTSQGVRCKNCYKKDLETNHAIKLTKYELAKLIYENNMTIVSKMFNISDKGVYRACERLGLPTHVKEIKKWFLENSSPDSSTE